MPDREGIAEMQPVSARLGSDARFLSHAGRRLLRAASDGTVEQTIAELAVEWFGGCCLLHVPDVGRIRLAAVAHAAEVSDSLARELPIRIAQDGTVERVIRSGVSESMCDVSAEDPMSGSGSAALQRTTGRIIAIRHAEGGVAGSLCIVRSSAEITSNDLAVFETLAGMGGEAIAARRSIDGQSTGHHRLGEGSLDEDLLAELAHELRSPIGAIIGYCDLFEGGRTDLAPLFFKRIQTAAKHQLNLIDQLAQLRSPRASEPIHLKSTDLRDVVGMAADAFFSTTSIRVRLDVPDEPVVCRTEPVKMQHVLVNLLANAANSAQGTPVELTLRALDNEAILQVAVAGTSDAARPAETQRRTDRPSNHVSSLNLAIARRLAMLVNGDVNVRTNAGAGTTFVVRVRLETDSGEQLSATLPSAAERAVPG